MILVFVLYALFASVFTVAKVGLEYTSPYFLVGSRMFAAGLIMLAYQYARSSASFKLTRTAIIRLTALGVINIYLTNVMEFWGLQYLTTFKTCFIYSLSPFVAAILSYFLLSETLTKKKALGLGLGFLGFIPILLHQTDLERISGEFGFISWAEGSVIVAAVASTYGWILLRQSVKDDRVPPVLANGISMTIGGGLALAHSFSTEGWHPLPVTEMMPFLQCTLFLIVVSNLLAYNLYGYLLQHFTATFLSFSGFSTPIITALFGWLFLGEHVNVYFITSASIVFFSLILFYQEELRIEGIVKADQAPLIAPVEN